MPSLRWGLLAASQIAHKFAYDLQSQNINITAIGSRDLNKAKAFAAQFNIPNIHGSYEALLQDPDVDIVYISVPNHLHAEWCIKAAEAGKHILCEKPLASTFLDCERIIKAVQKADVFFMEGFMFRCHPIWEKVKELIAQGKIGRKRFLQSTFCFNMGLQLKNGRQSSDSFGGALMDIGCYGLAFSRLIAGEEPERLHIEAAMGIESNVDEWSSILLRFPSGILSNIQCAIRVPAPQFAIIFGDRGRIEIPSPWHLHKDNAQLKMIDSSGKEEVLLVGDGLPQFAREALMVEKYIEARQCPAMNWEDSLGQAKAIEELRKQLSYGPLNPPEIA